MKSIVRASIAGVVAVSLAAALVVWVRSVDRNDAGADSNVEARITRGDLTVQLVENGTLRAAESFTYRSPVEGRETEITFLAPEGLRVKAGDLVIRLDPTGLQEELERTRGFARQAALDLQIAGAESKDAEAALKVGEGSSEALEIEEADANLLLARRRIERARKDLESLTPLLKSGFITREELDRVAATLDDAEIAGRLALKRREALRLDVQPRRHNQAQVRAVQQSARYTNAVERVDSLRMQIERQQQAIAATSVYARSGGLVVYEDYLGALPPRRIRVGDRVTPSHGILTIPEVEKMLVHASVRERDVHRVSVGMPVAVRPEAFPGLTLAGHVATLGTLARGVIGQPLDERRFELIVSIDIADPRLRPEMSARLDIQIAERKNALLIPINAVFRRAERTVAHFLADGEIDTRVVELGPADRNHFELISGAVAGERVSLLDRAADGGGSPQKPNVTAAQ